MSSPDFGSVGGGTDAEYILELDSPPPRIFVGVEDTAGGEDMTTSSMAASQREGHCVPVLSTPVRNNIARIMDKDDDAFFDREETVNGVATFIYKPVGPFTTDVSVEEVKRVVSVSESGLRWVTAEGSDEDPHRRANTFRKWILPLFPPHLAIACDQPILFALSENSGVL
jgi:hypothetical protein